MSDELKKITPPVESNIASPVFVEAEKMLDKLGAITRETAAKAYDFFVDRGAELGTHFEDWLRAESELLRTAPAKITETKDTVVIMIAVPGFKAEEIEVSVKDNLLIVSGESAVEDKKEEENVFYNEWRSNRFIRNLTLPSEVINEKTDAVLKDGVLTLTLKKKAEEEAAKVAVKAA
ncbi:hypothetical protein BH10ACI2_BH10ACI2_07190 [soil metagenome]